MWRPSGGSKELKLNLGCSTDIRKGWWNVDRYFIDGVDQVFDLALPWWVWGDSSVDEIYAADIFEHVCDVPGGFVSYQIHPDGQTAPVLRHPSGRIHTMNESWRVLKAGGILRMECPDAAKGAGQWQDPTHVTPWTPNGLQYFEDGSPAWQRFHEAYGITARFKVLGVSERKYTEFAPQKGGLDVPTVRCEVWKFTAVLEAVK